MCKYFLTIIAFVLTACSTTVERVDALVAWGSDEGVHRLATASYKADFFQLANHFEGQSNKIFCGPTSAAIVLNALRVRKSDIELPQDTSVLKPQDLKYLPAKSKWSPFYKRYTPNNILDKSPKSREIVLGKPVIGEDGKSKKDFGLQLHQLAELLEAHDLDVGSYVVGDDSDIGELKSVLIDSLKRENSYVIVNYKRSALNQPGGGHISPLGAYHKATDSFLVLDTAPNKAGWAWVKAASLIEAMRTFDIIENRGFVVVKEQ